MLAQSVLRAWSLISVGARPASGFSVFWLWYRSLLFRTCHVVAAGAAELLGAVSGSQGWARGCAAGHSIGTWPGDRDRDSPASWLPPSSAGTALCPSPHQGKGFGRRVAERGGLQEGKNKTKSIPREASLGSDVCELYEIDNRLPSCFLKIPLPWKACSAHQPQSGRKNWVSQEPLPRSVLIRHSSAAFYIAFGSTHSADFPANEDVLHLGKAAWNENHIYFATVVAGCPSLAYTDLGSCRKGHRASLGAFSASGLRRVINP